MLYSQIFWIWMTQYFLVLKVCSHSIACVTCFLISGSKKAMMQFFWVWFLKLKQQDTRVNYNKDKVIQRWAQKRKKRKKTKKARHTTSWLSFNLMTRGMEKSKDGQAACHIDCKFLMLNLFITKNVIRLLSTQSHKLRLILFCNQTVVVIIIIANVITAIVTSIGNQSQTLKLALDFQIFN